MGSFAREISFNILLSRSVRTMSVPGSHRSPATGETMSPHLYGWIALVRAPPRSVRA